MSIPWPTVEGMSCIKSANIYKGACCDPGNLPGTVRKAKQKDVKYWQMQTRLMRTAWAELRFVGQ